MDLTIWIPIGTWLLKYCPEGGINESFLVASPYTSSNTRMGAQTFKYGPMRFLQKKSEVIPTFYRRDRGGRSWGREAP